MKGDRQLIFNKYGGKCAYCGCELVKGWHVDEIEPIIRSKRYLEDLNGNRIWNTEKHEWVTENYLEFPDRLHINNQNPSCASCNILKNRNTLEGFRDMITQFIQSLNLYTNQYKFAKRYGLVIETDKPVIFYFEKDRVYLNKNFTMAGRPTSYKEEYNEQAYKLCLLGATDEELAAFFLINIDTVYEWKNKHSEFSEAVTRGKIIADAEIANSFYKKAKGYDLPSEKIFQCEGEIIRANTITHYPPDAGAALNWLKNRQPKKWRDKTDVEHTGKDGESLQPMAINVYNVGPPLASSEDEISE